MKASKKMGISVFLTSLLMTSVMAADFQVIDLSFTLKEDEDVSWPIYPRYNFTVVQRGISLELGSWVEYNNIALAEHTGTHMDAPVHFAKGHWRTHQIPVERLVGPGVVIDVRDKVVGNDDYGVTVKDLQDWEATHGRIPNDAVVLINFGWASRYPSRERVFNPGPGGNLENTSTFHFPGVTGEAAQWLADNRPISALGADVPSPDIVTSGKFPVHKILLGKDILILENVAHISKLPPTGSTIIMGVMNIWDGSGGPMRLLALVNHVTCPLVSCDSNDSADQHLPSMITIAASVFLSAVLIVFKL